MATQATAAPPAQVRVQLRSHDADIALPDTGPILVSTELRRYQLSTLVNRLLETDKPIPLEFLVNGQFLRTSLDEFLTQNGISAETTLKVEYVKALVPPLHVSSYEHDDWISSVDVLSRGQSRLLSGTYDGSLRVWDASSNVVATGQWHKARPNAVKFLSTSQVVSAGIDRSVRLWDFQDAETGTGPGTLKPKLELCGHKSSVEGMAVHAPTLRILTASTDHRVGVWTAKKSEAPPAPESRQPASTSNKRRKISGPEVSTPQRGALTMMEGHQNHVSDVCFDEKDATVAYSASIDHSVKTWDLTTSSCVDTRATGQSLSAILHLPEHSLIAAGGYQRYINLVDPRASATTVSAMTLHGHQAIVTSLSRDPNSSYQFVSASGDSTCRIWDIRSAKSEAGGERVGQNVFVIDRASQKDAGKPAQGAASKVFSVCWNSDVGIVSGGQDKMLQINKAP